MTPFLLPGGATDVSSQARPGTRGRCAKAGLEAAQGEGEPQNRGSTQPTGRRAVASAAERSREPPHPLTRTPGGPGRPAKEVGGSTGQRQGTGRADLRLEPKGRLGACRRRTRRGPPPTHTPPGPTPGHFLPCSARPRCLRSPLSRRYLCRLLPRWGPAACSPATAPGAGSAWGRGYAGGGTAAEGAGPARESSAAGSAAGGDWKPGGGQGSGQSERLPHDRPGPAQQTVGPPVLG